MKTKTIISKKNVKKAKKTIRLIKKAVQNRTIMGMLSGASN